MTITLNSLANLSNTFNLSSNPTATKTIYLDFDGYYSAKSVWENGADLSLGAFYSNLTADATRTEIQRIWARVAEDFAPFNVNVTTREPNSEDLKNTGGTDDRWGIRAAFTNNINLLTGTAIKNAGGGGTAYYNSFNWSTDEVALIFNRGAYSAAETASHEIGHSLGLGHDGQGTTEYYGGHGTGTTAWATIMGAAYLGPDENVTQWSKGEYFAANNTQDDLSVITGNNGFTYRVDDHQNTIASATNLTGTTFSAFGIIERNTDIDMFKFTSLGGLVNLNINNAVRTYVFNGTTWDTQYLQTQGPNLDIAATIYDSNGNVVSVYNPQDTVDLNISVTLAAGTYYLGIDGVGTGNPTASTPTGYTDYGSLGQYVINGTATLTPPNYQVLDPNGSVQLLRDTNTENVAVRVGTVTTLIGYLGRQLKATEFVGWQILAAETNNGQNQILWKELSTGRFQAWGMDSNWVYATSGQNFDPGSTQGILYQQQFQVSATGTPLQPITSQVLDPNGSVQLLRNTATNIVSVKVGSVESLVKYQGSPITFTQFTGWQPIAAETINGANQIIWRNSTINSFVIWNMNSSWNWVSSGNVFGTTSTQGIQAQSQFMVTATGTPTTTTPPDPSIVEINGAVSLLRDLTTNRVSVKISEVVSPVKYQGSQINWTQFVGWQPVAAEVIGGVNQIAWRNDSIQSFVVWTMDSNWNWVSSGSVFATDSTQGLQVQQQFQVNSLGVSMAPPINDAVKVLDPNGGTVLLTDKVTKNILINESGRINPLMFQGTQVRSDSFNGWQILAAEVLTGGQKKILWKELATGGLHSWSVDSNWVYVKSDEVFQPSSIDGILLQQQFKVDTSGTPLAIQPMTSTTINYQTIDPNGAVKLLRDPNTNQVAVGVNDTIIPIMYQGAQLRSNQFTGWQILAAETIGGTQNQILWKELSTGRFQVWGMDSNWVYATSGLNYDPSSAQGLWYQQQFMVDSIGVPTNGQLSSEIQIIDPNGTVQLLRNITTDLVSVGINGVSSPVTFQGSQLKSNQFAGWQILAAEVIDGKNKILWKQLSTGGFHTWEVGSTWNWVKSEAVYSPTSAEGLLLQNQFGLNINAPIGNLVDPITGFTTKEMLPACACANCTASTTALDTRTVPVYDNFKSNEKTFSLQLSSTNQPIVDNSLTSIILSSGKSSLPQNPQPLI